MSTSPLSLKQELKFSSCKKLQLNNLALCCLYVKDSNAEDFWKLLHKVLVRKIPAANASIGNKCDWVRKKDDYLQKAEDTTFFLKQLIDM